MYLPKSELLIHFEMLQMIFLYLSRGTVMLFRVPSSIDFTCWVKTLRDWIIFAVTASASACVLTLPNISSRYSGTLEHQSLWLHSLSIFAFNRKDLLFESFPIQFISARNKLYCHTLRKLLRLLLNSTISYVFKTHSSIAHIKYFIYLFENDSPISIHQTGVHFCKCPKSMALLWCQSNGRIPISSDRQHPNSSTSNANDFQTNWNVSKFHSMLTHFELNSTVCS